jgi:hypothetical protein
MACQHCELYDFPLLLIPIDSAGFFFVSCLHEEELYLD